MKLTATVFLALSLIVALILPGFWLYPPLIFGIGFAAFGVAKSASSNRRLVNDLPNAFRVFLASLAGVLLVQDSVFIYPAVGLLLYPWALFLNDEYQRPVFRSIRTGRKGGSVAFLGIDGSGKSTHAKATAGWLRERGYEVTLMPFHRYLFVERLATLSRSGQGGGRRSRGRGNPFRPFLSLADNLILQITTSLGCRVEGRVVLYDRFIWSTYIKYEALGYPVRPLERFYLMPRPFFAMVLNVPVERSLRVIEERGSSHIHYPRRVLSAEREKYLDIAETRHYPEIDSTQPFEEVQALIESHLSRLFPRMSGA